MRVRPFLPALLLACAGGSFAGCSSGGGGKGAPVFGTDDPFDVPIKGLTAEQENTFAAGDALFDLSLRPYDGLGPLFTRSACSDCHDEGTRGPGLVQKMVVTDADGVTPAADQSVFAYGQTVHPLVVTESNAKTPIMPPDGTVGLKVTIRVGPPILGRGYMEAVTDAEIERVAAAQAARSDGIHGRINYVTYASKPNPVTSYHANKEGDRVIGRFGLKARIATIDDFTADALQGDMGITSPLRPDEFENPDGLTDDLKPGVDVTIDSVNQRADYIRTTAIPLRRPVAQRGAQVFAQAKCAVCHVPTMRTRTDYPIAVLAGIDAPIYTDILVHYMGDDLADGITDGAASGRYWRTAPLIGLRFNRTFMHDGRAHDVAEAVAAHKGAGSEANDSVGLYEGLSDADRRALLSFVESL
jgi:CxxC motif-containing protein (DUF1111 family)